MISNVTKKFVNTNLQKEYFPNDGKNANKLL